MRGECGDESMRQAVVSALCVCVLDCRSGAYEIGNPHHVQGNAGASDEYDGASDAFVVHSRDGRQSTHTDA